MTVVRFYQFLEGFDVSGAVYNFVQKVENAARKVSDVVATWSKRNTERRQLNRLSDRLLEDIGITRFDVQREVTKHFWQK